MTEPKKRGRPSKAELAAREAAKQQEPQEPVPEQPAGDQTHNGDESYWPAVTQEEPMAQTPVLLQPTDEEQQAREKAQAFALRVWNSQSSSLGRGVRVARIRKALEGKGMSMDGVKLPGDRD